MIDGDGAAFMAMGDEIEIEAIATYQHAVQSRRKHRDKQNPTCTG